MEELILISVREAPPNTDLTLDKRGVCTFLFTHLRYLRIIMLTRGVDLGGQRHATRPVE